MELQQKIVEENLEKLIGKKIEVCIEDQTFDKKYYVGRSYRDVPQIDGYIYVEKAEKVEKKGKYITCQIIDKNGYDLIAKIV